MSISKQEEIISVLWAIAALTAFGFGYEIWGWIFAVKAASDAAWAIYSGIDEALRKSQAT